MWQGEHRVQSLNISFVGVLYTGETHICDSETHLVPRQRLGSRRTKSPLNTRLSETAVYTYMCTTDRDPSGNEIMQEFPFSVTPHLHFLKVQLINKIAQVKNSLHIKASLSNLDHILNDHIDTGIWNKSLAKSLGE